MIVVIKDVMFERRQRICQGGKSHSLDIAVVITRASRVIIGAVIDTVIDYQRKKGNRGVRRKDPLYDVIPFDLDIDEMLQLCLVRLWQVFIALEC